MFMCDVHARDLIGLRQVRNTRHVLGSKGSRGWDLGVVIQVSRLPNSLFLGVGSPIRFTNDTVSAKIQPQL